LRGRGAANEGHADGPALAEIHVGLSQADGRIPAQRAGEPTVYWLAAGAKEALPVGLGAWRDSFRAKQEPAPAAATPEEAPGAPVQTEPAPAE
jgi:hypothetical protein